LYHDLHEELPAEDVRNYIQIRQVPLPNNMQLEDVNRAASVNSLVSEFHGDRLRTYLNDAAKNSQTIQLEERFLELNKRFQIASDPVRDHVLKGMEDAMRRLEQEERNLAFIQDPPEFQGRRTYRQGGKRIPTGAETAEKELKRNERIARKEAASQQRAQSSGQRDLQASKQSDLSSIDPSKISSLGGSPFTMTFNSSGALVRRAKQNEEFQVPYSRPTHHGQPPESTPHSSLSSTSASGNLTSTANNVQSLADQQMIAAIPSRPSPNVISRPIRQLKRPNFYEGEPIQSPQKRTRKN